MIPYSVDKTKWQSYSIFEQMGNIGSEVGRSLAAKRRGDERIAEAAVVRALDLFNATVSDPTLSAPRRREILRAKEEFLKAYFDSKNDNGIEGYFMQFAIAARLSR